jgi:hypothetical protein
MNTTDLIAQIKGTAQKAEQAGQKVSIDNMLPTVSVVRGDDDEYFFQEHEAQDLIDRCEKLISDLGEDAEQSLSVEEVILHQAQGW